MDSTALPRLVDELLQTAHGANSGRASHTLYGDSTRRLRQTVIALTAHGTLAEHASPAEATLQVLRGHVTLTTADDTWVGIDGDIVTIPAARHSLSAQQDSAVLLTVRTD